MRALRGLACLALLGLASCLGPSRPPPSPALTRIVETGQLRVGMSGEQPPLNMVSRRGEMIGMEVALVRVLARSMGVEARFVRRPFAELLEALERRDVDVVMSGMTITPERSTRVRFVGPYFVSGKSFVTRSPLLSRAESPAELDSPDLRVAVLRGSTSEAFAERALPSARRVATDRLEEAIEKLVDGDVDLLLADRETCAFAVLRHPEAGLVAAEASFTVEPMGIAVPLNQPNLASLLENYLDALHQSGALEKARRFWFRDPSWVKQIR